MILRLLYGLLTLTLLGPAAHAGVFLDMHNTAPQHPTFTVVHSPGYTGTGGTLALSVCVEPESPPALREAVDQAIATWNNLLPMTGNCLGCLTLEEPDPAPRPLPVIELFQTVLHELGHCAMGLDHPNWLLDPMNGQPPIPTDFTAGRAVQSWSDPDGVPGSQDDRPSPSPGSLLIHWYRIADNDPVIVDGTIIDRNTYTRSLAPLIGMGQFWAANANRRSAELLGAVNTQTVMFAAQSEGTNTLGLASDEVNMARFAATGLDKLDGTDDDYQVALEIAETCADATIRVSFDRLPAGTNGSCIASLEQMPVQPDPTAQHYVVAPFPGETQLLVRINSLTDWDFELVFIDGFAGGDTSEWTLTVP